MSKKITTELHILANVEQAEASLKGLEKSIENLWGKGAAPKSFSNGIDALTNKLFSLKNATDESFRIDETALKQAGRDYKKLAERIDALTISLSSMSEEQKRSLLNDKEKKAWEERVEAVKKYNKELKRSEELAAEKAALEVKKKTLIGQKSALVKPILGERGQRVQDYDKLAAEKAIAEKVVKDWRDKGKSETSGRENDFTRAQKNIREVEQKMAQMGLTSEDINAGRKELADYAEGVKDFDSKIAGLDKNIDELTDKINSIVPDGADAKLAALKEKLSSLGVEGVKDAKTFADVEKALNDFDKKALEPVEAEIENATHYLAKMKNEAKAMGERVDESTESLKKETQAAADTKAFEDRIKAFLGVSGAVKVLHSAIRDALATIKELDATMTEMAVVTDLSVGDYWDQLPEYSQRASELGVSINDAYKSATLYYQQGLKTNEVNAISVETLKMAKIANMDAADATDKMTAALRGFNMELNEASAKKVADVYSELAAITAADTQEIANAMTKTASIASSAGMEFETTAAFLSQIIETTRESAETAGTAMKTVIARFQELKKAPDEIGEVDGEIVDANAIETALRSVGVSLRDTNGQFRDLDDVFLELSSKWDGLDKNTQRYIATIAAGSRQQSRFIAMMSDYSRTQELVTSANNSAGASQEQFNKTLEGLDAKLEKLKNAWHEFTMGIMNSDLVKLGVDIVTKFLETINKATSAFDGLGGSIVKILSILTVFKVGKTIFEKMKEPMISFFAEIVKKAGETGEAAGDAAKEGLERSKRKAEKEDKKEEKQNKKGFFGKIENAWEKFGEVKKAKKDLPGAEKRKYKVESELQSTNGKIEELEAILSKDTAVRFIEEKAQELRDKRNALKGEENKEEREKINKEIWQFFTDTGYDNKKKDKIDPNKKEKIIKELNEAREDQTRQVNQLAKAEKELSEVQNKLAPEEQEKAWAAYADGVNQVGQSVSGAGVTMSIFGGILSSLGLEEAGEAFAKIGNFATLAGSAVSSLGPIITSIVGKLVAGGMTTAAAWAWVVGVIAAVTVIGFLLAAAVKNIQASSPEGKLKAAEEAANGAAEAADRAAESYDNLKNSLDALDDKYDSLEDLTRGTKEWNEAVQEINDSVLTLISEYPELAQFIQNKNGVLTIDIDSAEVQQVLKESGKAKITTANASILAQDRVSDRQMNKQFADLEVMQDYKTSFGLEAGIGSENLQAAFVELSNKISNGEVFSKGQIKEYFLGLGELESRAEHLATYISKDTEALIKFGKAMKQEQMQSEARYEAMATQAEQLANLSGWTTEEIARGQNLIDSDIYQEFERQAAKEIENIDLTKVDNLNSLVGEDKRLLDEAIQQIYGENAYRKGDQVVFVDENGTTQTEKLELRKDQITDTMKSIKATELTASAMENSRETIRKLDKATNGAMSKLYNDIGGGQLTQTDLQNLMGVNAREIWDSLGSEGQGSYNGDFEKFQEKLISNRAMELWESLGEEERNNFGNNFETFKKDFEGAIEATKSFNDIREKLSSFDKELDVDKLLDPNKVSRDTAIGLEKQISAIIERLQIQGKDIKAEGGVIDIADQYLAIMDKVGTDLQDDFAAQFASLDLTDLDALNKFRYDLIHTYQIEEGEVDNLINTITEATLAISATILEISNYGPLQEAQQKTAKLIEEMTELQWQYNEAIRMSGNNLQELTKKLQENLRQQINASTEAYRESQTNLAKIYAQGANQANGTDFRDYVTLDESGGYTVDYEKLNRDRGSIDQEAFDKWFESFSKTYDQMLGYEESARASYNELVKLQTDSKEAYQELRDMAKEAVLDKMQKQLELQEETLDATKQANSQLINKLQEQINEDKQTRQNEEAEKNLLDMQSKLAYLSMDTSGANDLAKLESQRQIEQAERQYQDSLVDQALQNLQDANAKAEEQRERQISLAERQLEAYQNSSQFQEDIDRLMQEALAAEDIMKSDLGALLTEMKTGGLSEQEKTDWQNELKVLGVGASSWISTDWGKMLSEEKAKIDNISDTINVIATSQNLKTLNQRKDLVAKGFDLDEINSIEDEKQLDKLTAFISREGDKDSIGSYSSQLDSSGVNYKSQQEYYDDILNQSYSKEFNPNDTQTYEQYLSSKTSNSKQDISRSERTKLVDQAAVLLSQGFSTGTADYQKLFTDYLKAGGTGDQWVEELAKKDLNITSSGRVLGEAAGWQNSPLGDWDENISVTIGDQSFSNLKAFAPIGYNRLVIAKDHDISDDTMKENGLPADTKIGSVTLYKGDPYILQNRRQEGRVWTKLYSADTEKVPPDLVKAMKKQVAFKSGGLADFTGPAWLDGTKSKPEIVLNQQDSANFLMLRDVLSEVLHGSTTLNNSNTNTSGDNHFEIEINVEKLENDYDVEQLADKVRRMIYDDASYRNVNAVGFIR